MGVTGEQSQVTRGEYLARVGDCYACHTVRGGQPYAGGLEMATPFGALYTTNITPDPETGIGKWTADDFWGALARRQIEGRVVPVPGDALHQLHEGDARGLRRDVRVFPDGQAGAAGQPAARRWAFRTTSAS